MSVSLYGSGNTVIQAVTNSLVTSVSTTSQSFVTSGLSASITPQSTTSKILVTVNAFVQTTTSSNGVGVAIARNGSVVFNPNSVDATNKYYYVYSGSGIYAPLSFQFLDSPSTTSSTTYAYYFASYSGGNVYGINPGNQANSTAYISLLEISGS